MNPVAIDIKDMLVADTDLGLNFGLNLHIGREPSTPNNVVTIFDTPSRPPAIGVGLDIGYEYPSIQIRVRGTSYINAWQLMRKIQDSLHGRAYETMNGTLYTAIFCSTGPGILDWDENNRIRLFINFEIQRRI